MLTPTPIYTWEPLQTAAPPTASLTKCAHVRGGSLRKHVGRVNAAAAAAATAERHKAQARAASGRVHHHSRRIERPMSGKAQKETVGTPRMRRMREQEAMRVHVAQGDEREQFAHKRRDCTSHAFHSGLAVPCTPPSARTLHILHMNGYPPPSSVHPTA